MMYSNGFVVCIRDEKGRVLRESRDREVFIPFYSHYSIRLKNNNNRRATAKIYIDGTDAMGDHSLILKPHETVDLERFMIDGDLSKGRKFKFVPLSDGRVQDPTSEENGIIEVRFTLEKEMPKVIEKERIIERPYPYPVYPPKPWPWEPWTPYQPTIWYSNTNSDIPMAGGETTSSSLRGEKISVNSLQADFEAFKCCSDSGEVAFDNVDVQETGATVEGAQSYQKFYEGFIGTLEDNYTELRIRLRPSKEPVTVQKTRKNNCTKCGSKVRASDKYCGNCGGKL